MPAIPDLYVMPTSVMPKGVEHGRTPQMSINGAPMPTSVMPKGVEHNHAEAQSTLNDVYAHLCDAERR